VQKARLKKKRQKRIQKQLEEVRQKLSDFVMRELVFQYTENFIKKFLLPEDCEIVTTLKGDQENDS
jgi:uncharacterized protein YeeX (DUF496 family)